MQVIKEGRTVDLDGAEWRKATKSGNNGQCVEVAFLPSVDPQNEDGTAEDSTES